jgi:thiamine-phosphate pyrophosphorylase
MVDAAGAALRGGAVMLQYRDKSAGDEEKTRRADALAQLCRRYGALFIVNDDPQLARTVGADGVHLGQSDLDPSAARAILGEQAIIGASCHGEPELARRAAARGVDYVAMGRFFPSQTKPGAPPADPEVLTRLRRELSIPLVAIGGVNPDNAAQLIRAGADLVAVIHALFSAQDITATARRFAALFP